MYDTISFFFFFGLQGIGVFAKPALHRPYAGLMCDVVFGLCLFFLSLSSIT